MPITINPEKLRELLEFILGRIPEFTSHNIAEALERFDAAFPHEESEPWKPKENDWYWYFEDDSDVFDSLWNNDAIDEARFAFGNCFKTKAKAESRLPFVKAALQNK